MRAINDPHIARFTFAGFQWPRFVASLTPLSGLRNKHETRKVCGPYYHSPTPNASGRGFYLDDAGQPFGRWQWADDVDGSHINHHGWCTDEFGDFEKIRGIVVLLPHGRFMAGWSMGEGMASSIEPEVFTDIVDAAHMADECARIAAEKEREYQEDQQTNDED